MIAADGSGGARGEIVRGRTHARPSRGTLGLVSILIGCSDLSVAPPVTPGVEVYVTVRGTVLGEDSGEPIEGLRVALARDEGLPGERLAEVETDVRGEYSIEVQVPGCVALGLIVFETPNWTGASTWFAAQQFSGIPGCREGLQTIDVEMVPRPPS